MQQYIIERITDRMGQDRTEEDYQIKKPLPGVEDPETAKQDKSTSYYGGYERKCQYE